MENSKVIGVHIGGKGISCAAFDLNTRSMVAGSQSEGRVNKDGKDRHILSLWSGQIRKAVNAINQEELVGIGFSIPGPFDYKNGIADYSGVPKYQELHGLNITEELSKRLMLDKAVEFRYINDAIAFATGEDWTNSASVSKRLSIIIGEGLGSAFIQNEAPLLSGSGVPQGGIIYNLPFKGRIAEDFLSIRGLLEKFKTEGKLLMSNEQSLILNAKNTDSGKKIFFDFGKELGEVLAPIVAKFGPQRVSFGGVIGSELDLYREGLESSIATDNLDIVFSVPQEKNELFLYGGARLFDTSYWGKVSPMLARMN